MDIQPRSWRDAGSVWLRCGRNKFTIEVAFTNEVTFTSEVGFTSWIVIPGIWHNLVILSRSLGRLNAVENTSLLLWVSLGIGVTIAGDTKLFFSGSSDWGIIRRARRINRQLDISENLESDSFQIM